MPTNDVSLVDFLILDKDEEALISSFAAMAKKGIASLAQDKAAPPPQNVAPSPIVSFFDKREKDEIIKEKLRQKIKNIDLGCLIRAAIVDHSVDALCKHPIFNQVWNERWRQCGRKKASEVPAPEYKPQETLHTFDLLKGIYIYGKYKSALKNEATKLFATSYLELAAQLGFFAALNAQASYFINTADKQQDAFTYAQKAAELYWTPGYLLLTVLYIAQGKLHEALLSLIMAEKLLPYSANMINNAYQGKTLDAILLPLMSGFGFRDWTDAKIQLAEWANLPISFVTNTLYPPATKLVEDIRSSTAHRTAVDLTEVEEPVSSDEKSDKESAMTLK